MRHPRRGACVAGRRCALFAAAASFADLARLAFTQMAFYGRRDPLVAAALLSALTGVAERDADRRHAQVLSELAAIVDDPQDRRCWPAHLAPALDGAAQVLVHH